MFNMIFFSRFKAYVSKMFFFLDKKHQQQNFPNFKYKSSVPLFYQFH